MTQLTNFSKALILLSVAGIFLLLGITCYHCTQNQQYYQSRQSPIQDRGDYQVIQQPNGSQVVVVKDQTSGADIFFDYMVFQTLFNNGGMNNVYGYYGNHRYDPNWSRDQSYYNSQTKSVVNNYYGSTDDSKSVTDKIKEVEYQKSKGFSKSNSETYKPSSGFRKVETSTDNGSKSDGFSKKFFSTPTTTSSPSYTPSSGFKSSSSPSYTPSTGFKSSSSSSYKPSSGFKSSSSSSSSSSYKSSSGFGKRKN